MLSAVQPGELAAWRSAVHGLLVDFAQAAANGQSVKGYSKSIAKLELDERSLEQASVWFERYTNIRRLVGSESVAFGVNPKRARTDLLTKGVRTPFYMLDSSLPAAQALPGPWREARVQRAKALPLTSKAESKPETLRVSEVPPGGAGDRDFLKKRLPVALEKFLRSPSLLGRKELLGLIDDYLATQGTSTRKFLVQGGLPSLGKRSR